MTHNRFLSLLFSLLLFTALLDAKRPVFFLYGTCQANALYTYLKANYSNNYEFRLIIPKIPLTSIDPKDNEYLKVADFFIYQDASREPELSPKYIINNVLKKSCAVIRLPSLGFVGYFPDFLGFENPQILSQPKECLFGSLRDCLARGLPDEKIIKMSKKGNFLTSSITIERFNKSMEYIREQEKDSDIKILDFIEENYRKVRLFHTPLHPTNFLLKEIIKRSLAVIGLEDQVEGNPIFNEEMLGFDRVTIYPCVYKHLDLQFPFDEGVYDQEILDQIHPGKSTDKGKKKRKK